MNSVFRRYMRYIPRQALIVYRLKDATIIGNFPPNPFLFWNRNFCQMLLLDHAIQQRVIIPLICYCACMHSSEGSVSTEQQFDLTPPCQCIKVSYIRPVMASAPRVFLFVKESLVPRVACQSVARIASWKSWSHWTGSAITTGVDLRKLVHVG